MRAMRTTRNHRRRGGFSLLELLIVLAIIGLIAAMVLPNLMGQQQRANIELAKQAVHSLEQSAKMYAVAHSGKFPSGSDWKAQLTQGEEVSGQRLQPITEAIPKDPWGNELNYEYPNTKAQTSVDKPAIWSSGPDGKDDNGSNDDINNWVIETK